METKETKNDFKHFILLGSLLFPALLILNTLLFKFFLAPKESFFFNLAAAIMVSWLLMLTLYYIWAIYFYNINFGWTDKDWQDRETKVFVEGSGPEPDGNPNSEETLGLPAGTIRGTIALTVLVIGLAMMIAALGLPGKISQNEFLIDHFEFLKTGFLMVIAFYFGSKSLELLKDRKQVIGVPSNTPPNTPPPLAGSPTGAPQQPFAGTASVAPIGDIATNTKSAIDFHDPSAKG
ncbi:MAG: hypothetical protein ACK5TU_09885 [Cyclobacteriaceae bacterium]